MSANSVTTTVNTPSAPEQFVLKREELLSALDAQIKYITDDRRSAGWTRWAIWGALATLTWLATDILYRPELSLSHAALLALGVFALWRFLEMIVTLFSPSTRASLAPTRFRIFAEVISSARLELVVSVARYSVILFALAWYGFYHVPLMWIYAVAALLFNVVVFAYGFLPLAFPTKHKSRLFIENLPSFIAMGILLGALIEVAHEIKVFKTELNLLEVRLAIIINAIFHLFSWLAADTTTAPLLEHLKQTRQDFAFGRISLDEATRQTDVALSGLKLTEALHPPVSAALTKAEELQSVLSDLKKLTDEASRLVSVMRDPGFEAKVDGVNNADLVRLLDKIDLELKGVTAKKSELEKAVAKLQISSQIIVLFSPESKQEVESITQKVATAIVEARKAQAEFTKQIAALKIASNELTQNPANQWANFSTKSAN